MISKFFTLIGWMTLIIPMWKLIRLAWKWLRSLPVPTNPREFWLWQHSTLWTWPQASSVGFGVGLAASKIPWVAAAVSAVSTAWKAFLNFIGAALAILISFITGG